MTFPRRYDKSTPESFDGSKGFLEVTLVSHNSEQIVSEFTCKSSAMLRTSTRVTSVRIQFNVLRTHSVFVIQQSVQVSIVNNKKCACNKYVCMDAHLYGCYEMGYASKTRADLVHPRFTK
jgi:hypothetical protein